MSMVRGCVWILICALLVVVECHQYTSFERSKRELACKSNGKVGWTQGTIVQPLDHFDSLNSVTFSQRYYVVEDYWDAPDGPFVISVAGEAAQNSPDGIDDEMGVVAQQNSGVVLTLEHRYFGESLPFTDLSTQHLYWLTVDQVLEDVASFIRYYQEIVNSKYNKTDRNKVVVMGGSYAGMLVSNLRLTYPDIIDVAWSSSGVVDAVFNFTDFDLAVAIGMGQKCAQIMREMSTQIESFLGIPDGNSYVKKIFNATGMSDNDFMWMLSDAETLPIQYGHFHNLCDPMMDAFDNGQDIVQAMADVCNSYFYPTYCGTVGPYLYSDQIMKQIIIAPYSGQRTWWWMVCNELSYAQTYPGQLGIRSPRITIDWHKEKCDTVFGTGVWPPDTDAFNAKYGGKNPKTTNVYYLNGSQDPWQWSAIRQSLSDSCPAWVMTGYDVGHCRDLHLADPVNDPQDVLNARVAAENFVYTILHS
ncbi:serine carboxypeptidase S28 family protein [Pelomyxa schiedti]|nr:serine carboxypeptidase S28 family protein [Pelomyxa schiedti]